MESNPFHERFHALFNPDTVAVIGASDKPDKLGYHVMKSLKEGGFQGRIVPVNPGATEIMGIAAFPSLAHYAGDIELAIVVVPAGKVPALFRECDAKGIRGIVLITAGFKEIDDPQGAEMQARLSDMTAGSRIPVIGPNTFGMINFHQGLNASFTPEFSRLRPGGVALVSQSGGVSHLLAFLGMHQNVGMSKIVGLGNRLNVDFPEMIHYLERDPDTTVIALYLEGVDDPRRLMDAAKATRGKKPIVAFKTGSALSGDSASLSHTGSLAGNAAVYEGALRQAGILTAESTQDLLDLAKAFSLSSPPGGRRMAVLTGQAGPGMAACDVLEDQGLKVARFERRTQATISGLLPPLALRTNPVDMGPAWYNSEAIQGIVRTVMEADEVDGILLLMMFASANRDAVSGLAEALRRWKQRKPIVTCLVAPPGVWDEQVTALENAGALTNLPTPERAAKAMAGLWKYREMVSMSVREPQRES